MHRGTGRCKYSPMSYFESFHTVLGAANDNMAHQERSMSPPIVTQMADTARSTARSSLSPLRHRALGRASTFSGSYEASKLRRTSSLGSTFSDSIDDARNSIKSTTDDILFPQAKNPDVSWIGHEPSHWHSLPLALALLPAAAGLLFEKGSIVITDVTLLALAAVFLNWSVRLPWDWYHSTQTITVQDDYPERTGRPSDTIHEEEDNEGSQTSRVASPAPSQRTAPSVDPNRQAYDESTAASELRIYEVLALMTCFVSPMVGAWLLHHIRAQLSRPSEGLVSNYNLTIFLLASELRPLSHLIKLVQARTLHLQRTVASNPHASSPGTPPLTPSTFQDLTSRLNELESHVTDTIPTSPNTPSKLLQSQMPDLTTQVRKSLQPDLDALNRAVRRYEKRATVLAMQTEKRLRDLESRMNDAITLAAAAERSTQSQKQRRASAGVLVLTVDWLAKAVLLPLHVFWGILMLPGHVLSALAMFWGETVKGRGSAARHASPRGGKADTARGSGGSGGERKRPSGITGGGVNGRGLKKSIQ